jgi:ABC-2 type transport system permease protein
MKILNIAFKDLLITLRDKKALALIILMPIALIFVLGMALSSMFSSGDAITIKKFDVAVADLDGGEESKRFMDFLRSDDIKSMIEIKEMGREEAMDKVKTGDIPALVVIPGGYSKAVKEGGSVKIEIYADPGSTLRSQIVESLVKSYAGVASAVQAAVGTSDEVLAPYGMRGYMIAPEIIKVVDVQGSGAGMEENNLQKKHTLSAMQYYSAAMLVMYILFVGMMGTASLMEERENKTLMRVLSTSASKASLLTGKVLGVFLVGVFDVSVLIAFTKLAFGSDWGDSPAGLIILSAAMIFAASGYALFFASLFKTSRGADSVSSVIVIVMSFLGGSMFPIMGMPPMLRAASKLTLNGWALNGYLDLMLGNGLSSIILPAVVLCGMGIVFLGAGVLRLRLE